LVVIEMSSKVLVSGANGFIASHTIAQLLADEHSVVGTVRQPEDRCNDHLRALPGASDRLEIVAADLTVPGAFNVYTNIDAILHMASPYSRISDAGEGRSAEGTLNDAKQEPGANTTLLASQLLDRRRMLT
jgi:nucleoside-diphosphate-sugar epimerase